MKESGWLIEMSLESVGGPPCWWTGKFKTGYLDSWSSNPIEVVRFARKEDAERVINGTLKKYFKAARATEHQWSDKRPDAEGGKG